MTDSIPALELARFCSGSLQCHSEAFTAVHLVVDPHVVVGRHDGMSPPQKKKKKKMLPLTHLSQTLQGLVTNFSGLMGAWRSCDGFVVFDLRSSCSDAVDAWYVRGWVFPRRNVLSFVVRTRVSDEK